MAWYADLSPCDYFGEADNQLIAVGWLDKAHPYTQGSVTAEFVAKLLTLLVDPWQPFISPGLHACEFCRISGGLGSLCYNGSWVSMGVNNLFVPGTGFLYVAPSLIAHYIDAHLYAPPAEFCQAVLQCPPMRSMNYRRAILRNGPRWLFKRN